MLRFCLYRKKMFILVKKKKNSLRRMDVEVCVVVVDDEKGREVLVIRKDRVPADSVGGAVEYVKRKASPRKPSVKQGVLKHTLVV